jgi:hypothetical protein
MRRDDDFRGEVDWLLALTFQLYACRLRASSFDA